MINTLKSVISDDHHLSISEQEFLRQQLSLSSAAAAGRAWIMNEGVSQSALLTGTSSSDGYHQRQGILSQPLLIRGRIAVGELYES